MTLEVVESVPGFVLVLQVGSKSVSDGTHRLTLELDGRRVDRVVCDCPGFRYRGRCHHAAAISDLAAEATPVLGRIHDP